MTGSMPPLSSRLKSHPLWVFLLFALGIVIPAGFLSFLGFRSYQYESVLIRKQLEERYRTLADVMQRKALEELQTPLAQLRAIAAQSAFSHWNFQAMISQLMILEQLDGVPLKGVYLFDAQDRLIFPRLNKTAAANGEEDLDWGFYAGEIHRLEELEFGQKKPREAAAGYSALLKQPMAPALKAALLKNIGAAAGRAGDDRTAESAYLRLTREYDSLPDPSGLPMGLVGRWLLAQHFYDTGRSEQAAALCLDLYEALLVQRWGPLAERDAWLKTIGDRISKTKGLAAAPENLKSQWNRLQLLGRRLAADEPRAADFYNAEWPEVLKRLRRHGWQESGGILRLVSPAGDWLVATPVMAAAGDRRVGLLAVRLPSEAIWSRATAQLSDLARPAGLQFSFNPSGSPALPGTKPALYRDLEAVDPPATLVLYQPVGQTEDKLSQKRLLIYAGMVGLSLLVILIGLGLMGLAVRREMEIAELKSDFVASVSHELRTPLSAIAYIAERLTRGRFRSDEQANTFYGMLSEETGRLQELIEDILDFSKMLGGKKVYNRQSMDLVDAAEEALERMQAKIKAGNFHIQVTLPEEPLPILGDSRAVVQAMTNLLDNAIKYSGESKALEFSLKRVGPLARVTIGDHGIGIPEAEQERIFEKFYRVESGPDRAVQSGVGLGLAMVKHIMQSHGGKAVVSSRVGEGSSFSLEFPLADASETLA